MLLLLVLFSFKELIYLSSIPCSCLPDTFVSTSMHYLYYQDSDLQCLGRLVLSFSYEEQGSFLASSKLNSIDPIVQH